MLTAALLRDPRAVKLSNQLRAQAAALASRNITTIPPAYVDEVADLLIAFGVDDLTTITGKTSLEYGPNLSQISMIGTEGEPSIQYGDFPITRLFIRGVDWPITYAERAIWNHRGVNDAFPVGVTLDTKFYVVVVYVDPPGAPLVMLVPFVRSNPWKGVAFIAGFVATAMGLPVIIGNAVLGVELAASYPALSNAIGQVATRTVLTGGDVEKAVSGAAAGLVGAEFGGFVGTAVDSAAIGAGAAAATTAALQGGDVRQAVLISVAKSGVFSEVAGAGRTMSEYIFDPDVIEPAGITLGDLDLGFDLTEVLSNLENVSDLPVPADSVTQDAAGNQLAVNGSYVQLSPEQYIASLYPDEAGNIRTPDNRILMPANEVLKYLEFEGGTVELADDLKARIEPLQGGVSVSEAPSVLRPSTIPPAASQTRTPVFDFAKQADALLKTAVSIGGSIKSIANGTFRPTYPISPFGTARPPVGVPVRQADGSTVVNNGNGTQTIRYPDGRVQTIPSTYTSTGMAGNYGGSLVPGISNQTLLIGGAVLVAALLIARR